MTESQGTAYVAAALTLQGYALSEDAVRDVREQFARIAQIAEAFVELPLPAALESAAVFRA
ncbi:DUF4089 domain-containing protein [Robbsia sp. Bb-Pol-6]|uniref:DUF4089 domain-containing protein n=1 Tax=Robbsia betulipollinis TaxID=2981849 RepID=A0ABT3ZIT8_9BURK|nr:DUF4089 domain-containing protein [Robbsia betulipollinis]MCY0386267.1 DUF4089 domain-containing protein [Robbsia betulipollinis]